MRRLYLAIHYAEDVIPPFSDVWFTRVAQAAVQAADRGPVGELEAALLLADDATLQQLNRRFRDTDQPTDVLSFAQHEGGALAVPPGAPVHLGDIAISVERATRQAEVYGHSLKREAAYLLVHGVLHLLGYDHEADEEQVAMRRVEEDALAHLGLQRTGAAA
jgi:rRNA maturation RNase YbeY